MFWARMALEIGVMIVIAVLVRHSRYLMSKLTITGVKRGTVILGVICGMLVIPFSVFWYWTNVVIQRHEALAAIGKYTMTDTDTTLARIGPVSAWNVMLVYCLICAVIVATWASIAPRISHATAYSKPSIPGGDTDAPAAPSDEND